MRHGSLFSGIGGFDLASEWMGWENVFHCEWNEFGQKVLQYYWPNAITYEDITKTDFTIHRGQIDILTGGFPCQPYSAAGKRLGKEDDRHLWPEMLRAIREIQPTWIVGENVLGLVNWNGGLVFEEVQADLEAEGYEVQPYVLPAVSVNAPHRRDRVWFVSRLISNSSDSRWDSRNKESEKRCKSDSKRISLNESDTFHGSRIITDTNCERYDEFPRGKDNNQESKICKKEQRNWNGIRAKTCGHCRSTSDTECNGRRENYRKGKSGFNHQKSPRDDWKNFPTQSPICDGDDGLSTRLDGITFSKWRNESIKGAGNAIVPQVAFQIFKSIQQYDEH